MRVKLVPSILIVMALVAIVGCGGGSQNNPPPVVSISAVTPASPTVRPGQTKQFSATVTGSSNVTVVWSLGAGAQGSISSTGLYTAPAPPVIPSGSTTATDTVIATAQADTTKSTNTSAVLVALTSLTISPRGPAVTLPGTAQNSVTLSASGKFSDGSKADWTANSAWTSSDTSIVGISSVSTVSGVNQGIATVTAADNFGSTKSDTTAVNVTSMSPAMTNANLSGHYAFTLTHAGQRGQAYVTGSFAADGNGNVTGGVEDLNSPVGGTSNAIAITSGSYTVYPDGRGTLSLITQQGTDVYTFVLSTTTNAGASIEGKIIRSDSGAVAVGTLELQDTSATLAVSSNYAFLLGGMDGTALSSSNCTSTNCIQKAIVLAGQFSIPSATNVSGTLDVNDNGTNSGGASGLAFTATFAAPDPSSGRGTLVLTPPASLSMQTPWSFAYYVVSGSKILLLQTDKQAFPLSSPALPALSGVAELQTFTTTAIAGNSYVFLLERSAAPGLFSDAGEWNFLAANAVTGEMDVNCLTGCATTTKNYASLAGSTYTSVAANGRGTVSLTGGASLNTAVFYLVSDERMYVLETDTKPDAGIAELQTNLTSPPTGTLAYNFGQLATNGFDSTFTGQIVTTNPVGIADSNIGTNCAPNSTNCVVTQHADAASNTFNAAVNGRGTATLSLASQTPNTTYGYYLVSPTKMVVFGLNSNVAGFQAIDGVIETQ